MAPGWSVPQKGSVFISPPKRQDKMRLLLVFVLFTALFSVESFSTGIASEGSGITISI